MYRFGKEEVDAMAKVVESGKFFRDTEGKGEVSKFEAEWSEKIGTKYSLLLSGGTDALVAALVGLGVGPGDEVIVPAYTFMATASAVVGAGAIPVLADVDETLTLDVADVERKISKNTKCIIPVHICGFPSNMDAIMALAKKHNILVLEDACQADGVSYKGKRLGSIGDAGAFSFNFYKIIGAGDGGCVVTNDRNVYERALIFHDGGAAFRPYAGELQNEVFVGYQFRVSELTGAFMRVQLQRMDGIIADLRKNKKYFMDCMKDTGVRFNPSNDLEGDGGVAIPMIFESEAQARKFKELADAKLVLPVDTGKHVYTNWTPILERRGAHCEALNPFKLKENQGLNMDTLRPDSCPKTLDLLSRTVFMKPSCDIAKDEFDARIERCRKAAKEVL